MISRTRAACSRFPALDLGGSRVFSYVPTGSISTEGSVLVSLKTCGGRQRTWHVELIRTPVIPTALGWRQSTTALSHAPDVSILYDYRWTQCCIRMKLGLQRLSKRCTYLPSLSWFRAARFLVFRLQHRIVTSIHTLNLHLD
jgi:hypothetical protein